MMKKFILKFSLISSIPFVLAVAYYGFIINPHRHGDLGLLGYKAFDDTYDSTLIVNALSENLVNEINSIEPALGESKILTIGDSFSQKGQYGYQNYLAHSLLDYTIYNIKPANNKNQYQYLVDMLETENNLPPVIIMEIVERNMPRKIGSIVFNSIKDSVDNSSKNMGDNDSSTNIFISNLKKAKDFVDEQIDRARGPLIHTQECLKKSFDIENPVKYLALNKKVFTCKGDESNLYFYQDDLLIPDKHTVEKSKQNLDSLFLLAESKNVLLIVLVASDKYDVYRKFAIDNHYCSTGSLTFYQKFNDNCRFINTKNLLLPLVEQGVMDIYKCNDSHWSPVGASFVGEELKKRIVSLLK